MLTSVKQENPRFPRIFVAPTGKMSNFLRGDYGALLKFGHRKSKAKVQILELKGNRIAIHLQDKAKKDCIWSALISFQSYFVRIISFPFGLLKKSLKTI